MDRAQLDLASSLYARREYQEAARAYLRVVDTAGGQREGLGLVLHRLGNCFFFMKDYGRALTCYDQALEDDTYTDRAKVWFNKAQCFGEIGDWEAALRCYDKIADDPSYPTPYRAQHNRGNALIELGRLEEAAAAFRAAAGDPANPASAAANFNGGLALMALRKYEEAAGLFTLASQDPDYPKASTALLRRAESLDLAGYRENALASYDAAAAAGAGLSEADVERVARLREDLTAGTAPARPTAQRPPAPAVPATSAEMAAPVEPVAVPGPVEVAAPVEAAPPVEAAAAQAAVAEAAVAEAAVEIPVAAPPVEAALPVDVPTAEWVVAMPPVQAQAAQTPPAPAASVEEMATPAPAQTVAAEQLPGPAPAPAAAPAPAPAPAETVGEARTPEGVAPEAASQAPREAMGLETYPPRTPEEVAAAYKSAMTPEESEEFEKAGRKARRRRLFRGCLLTVILVLVLAVAGASVAYYGFDFGIPSKDEVISGAIDAWANGRPNDIRPYVANGSAAVIDEFKAIPLPVLRNRIESYDRVPRGVRAIVVVTSGKRAAEADLRYSFELRRYGISWRIVRVSLQ